MALFLLNPYQSLCFFWFVSGFVGDEIGAAMKNNYVLIDYENVQPKNLELLKDHEVSVKVFVGEKLAKVPFDLATAMQSLGDKAEYIKIVGNGPNALDFHIAFYMGKISAEDPNAFFHVISKDTGFDPLIKHLRSRNVLAKRERDIAEIPCIQIVRASIPERMEAYVGYLIGRPENGKPSKVSSLKNSIKNHFSNLLGSDDITDVYEALLKRKVVVVIDENKVSYNLPK